MPLLTTSCVAESHQAQAGPQGHDVPAPRELHAWQTPCPSVTGPLPSSIWQSGPDSSFQRAAEIVATAATEAAAAAAAAVVAAAGTKIREQMEAMHASRAAAPSVAQGAHASHPRHEVRACPTSFSIACLR